MKAALNGGRCFGQDHEILLQNGCISFELFLRHQRIRNPSLRTCTEYISSFVYESGLCRYVDNSYHVPQLLPLFLNSRYTGREKMDYLTTLYQINLQKTVVAKLISRPVNSLLFYGTGHSTIVFTKHPPY